MGGIVVGSAGAESGLSAAVILSNVGAQPLKFLGSAWTSSVDAGDGPITYTNITNGDLGNGFTSSSLPQVGDILQTNQAVTIPIKFLATTTGSYSTFVEFWTTGGAGYILLTVSIKLHCPTMPQEQNYTQTCPFYSILWI
jgi:iron transport multicopper oxidase